MVLERPNPLVFVPGPADGNVRDLLFKAAPPGDFDWSDFDHVGRLLQGTLGTGATGVNVFVYGSPGVGKTRFCKTLGPPWKARMSLRRCCAGVAAKPDGQRKVGF